jgi:methylated-DNA-[protein]-cysteine S-methyltransferase
MDEFRSTSKNPDEQDRRHRLPAGSAWGEYDSPIGPLDLVVTPEGLLVLGFNRLAAIAGAFTATPPDTEPLPLAEHEYGRQITRELREYFAGARKEFTVPVDWTLTSGVQRSILTTLYEQVPFGSTVGYGDLALLSGRTLGASRLVGTVMGSNPVAIVVPCHRVIAADGGIGGFGGGLEAKRVLLTLEGSLAPTLF